MNNHTCPICGEKYNIDDEFCNNCSWELIDIPKDSKDALFDYFNKKVNNHKQLFNKIIDYQKTIKQINEENYELYKTVEELKKQNKQLSEVNNKLNNEIILKKDIEKQLNAYVNRYGDSFEINSTTNKKKILVYWKIENNKMKLSSEISDLGNKISKIAVLFRKKNSPQIGNFDFTIIGEIKNNIVKMELTDFPKGDYLVKPISISNKKINVIFMSEEKSKKASDYNINNVKIHI